MTVNVFTDGLDSKVVSQQSFIDAVVVNLTRAGQGTGKLKAKLIKAENTSSTPRTILAVLNFSHRIL